MTYSMCITLIWLASVLVSSRGGIIGVQKNRLSCGNVGKVFLSMTAKLMKNVTSIFVSGPTYGLRQCVGYLLQVDPFLHLQANFWWAWV
jgi:hypothetical protein